MPSINIEELKKINDFLSGFGKELSGKPLFRVVWSDEQTEKRYGTYNEFSGKIYLRTVTNTRETRKYPYIKERWVLEKFMRAEQAYTPEIPSTIAGSYEPLYVYQTADGEYLPLNLEFSRFIMWALMNPEESCKIKNKLEDEEVNIEKKADQELFDIMEDATPIISNRLVNHEGIIVPDFDKFKLEDKNAS